MPATVDHLQESDAPRWGHLLQRAFGLPVAEVDEVLAQVGVDNVRVWRQDGQVDGCLTILAMGQWFGCRRVPMAGIAGVAVAPEARGRGVSTRLLRATAEECRGRGFALSVLYPTTWPVYRKVGYELAGSQFEARTEASRIKVSVRGERARTLGVEERGEARTVYGQIAANRNGWIDRNEYIWHRVFEPRGKDTFGYVVGDRDDATGYVVACAKDVDGHIDLYLTDLQARTAEAVEQLLTLLADHRSTVRHVTWSSGGVDPVLLRFPDKAVDLKVRRQWMMRILDVPQALRRRGYAVGIEAELHLEVHGDDVIAANNGRFVVQVQDGRARVEPGGRGDLKVSLRALAPLYSGYLTSWALRDGGLLEAEPPALSVASTLFGTGGHPCMLDMF